MKPPVSEGPDEAHPLRGSEKSNRRRSRNDYNLVMFLLIVVAAYLIGAVPFGYLIARARGIDIFQAGSGNIGATNVGRVLGMRWGILVFFLDFCKGAGPVLWARMSNIEIHEALGSDGLPVAAALAAFLGHLFPVYLRFRGGKGVATAAGAVAVLVPVPTAAALVVWLLVACTSRYVSLASIVASICLCVFRMLTVPAPWSPEHRVLTGFCVLAAGLVLARHRGNLGRLVRGEESRLQNDALWLQVGKVWHVLALGLWFGGGVFFSFVAAPALFHTFEHWTDHAWLVSELPEGAGTRLAGTAVGPIFAWYYPVQGVCALIALITALSWSNREPGSRWERLRVFVLVLAFTGVTIGWPIARHVSDLRRDRYTDDKVNTAFRQWHGISMGVNVLTLFLAGMAMAGTARLPERNATASSA